VRLVISVPQAVIGLATKPVSLVTGVDHLITQLNQVAARALALLDVAEPVAERVAATVERADAVAADVEALVARAGAITDEADAATAQAAATITRIQPLLDELAPLLQTVGSLEREKLVGLVESLPAVLEKLAAQVDNLDRTVADVGALLQGIPGAARLAKRGATLAPR
jgi:ABC-type transporter Mla subunit MlaD